MLLVAEKNKLSVFDRRGAKPKNNCYRVLPGGNNLVHFLVLFLFCFSPDAGNVNLAMVFKFLRKEIFCKIVPLPYFS